MGADAPGAGEAGVCVGDGAGKRPNAVIHGGRDQFLKLRAGLGEGRRDGLLLFALAVWVVCGVDGHVGSMPQTTRPRSSSYLPHGMNLKEVTQEQLDEIAHRLNNRTRKTLGFMTPS